MAASVLCRPTVVETPARFDAVNAGDATAHSRALLLDARCPACAELLAPRSLFGSAPCSTCDAIVDASLGGRELAAAAQSRGRRQLIGVAVAVAIAHLLLGWVPLTSALILLLAAVWIRVGILQPASAMLSPRRRVLTRWTARLVMAAAVAVTVIATEALTLVPLAGPIAKGIVGAGEVAIVAWAVTRYAHWQLEREAQGRDIAAWEWIVLGACAAALVASVVTLALVFAALASAFDSLLGWLR